MTRQIPLTHGYVALVDDEDAERVLKYKWAVTKAHSIYYARAVGGAVSMHRLLMGFPIGLEVDHINHDGLDNRRQNLRVCTHQQNLSNQRTQKRDKTSRYQGVTKSPSSDGWLAQIKVWQKHIGLGCFDTEMDAAAAYNIAARKHFGEFASCNVLPEGFDEQAAVGRRRSGTLVPGAPRTSAYRGVSRTSSGRWLACHCFGGHKHNLGVFDQEADAACAYNAAVMALFGDRARLNVIEEVA